MGYWLIALEIHTKLYRSIYIYAQIKNLVTGWLGGGVWMSDALLLSMHCGLFILWIKLFKVHHALYVTLAWVQSKIGRNQNGHLWLWLLSFSAMMTKFGLSLALVMQRPSLLCTLTSWLCSLGDGLPTAWVPHYWVNEFTLKTTALVFLKARQISFGTSYS